MKALYTIITKGKVGETYNIGANNQISNIKLVKNICNFLDSEIEDKPKEMKSYKDLIIYVKKFPLWKITFIKTLTQLDIKFAIDKYSTD